MSGIADTILTILKKIGYMATEYGLTAYYWNVKFIRIQLQKWKKCGAKKRTDEAYSSLGAEIYSLHKQGESNWQDMPSVKQQIKMVEETESKIFVVDEIVDEIEKDFQNKKEELKEKYRRMREELPGDESEE